MIGVFVSGKYVTAFYQIAIQIFLQIKRFILFFKLTNSLNYLKQFNYLYFRECFIPLHQPNELFDRLKTRQNDAEGWFLNRYLLIKNKE